jgi:hypothetical protein
LKSFALRAARTLADQALDVGTVEPRATDALVGFQIRPSVRAGAATPRTPPTPAASACVLAIAGVGR